VVVSGEVGVGRPLAPARLMRYDAHTRLGVPGPRHHAGQAPVGAQVGVCRYGAEEGDSRGAGQGCGVKLLGRRGGTPSRRVHAESKEAQGLRATHIPLWHTTNGHLVTWPSVPCILVDRRADGA
jgi:hypothetical protein